MHCNNVFVPGKLTTLLDGGGGSSGKGKIGSFITANADNWQFACNTFAAQAGHWVRLRDGRQFFYQTLNSCAYNHDNFEKLYLGPGSLIELPALLREIEENNIPRSKIGISPVIPILADIDGMFERGQLGFDGAPADTHEGTARFGSTCHGIGSLAARRVLRRPSLQLAKDIPELRDMICDVPTEIMSRLDSGQSGFLELAQGFQLSNMHPQFFPFVTYRNVTVAQGFADMFLPVQYAGPVVLNFRTYPIRINSDKFIALADGRHLTWAEVEAGEPHTRYQGNSGPWYPDQQEITWDELTRMSGSKDRIFEITSVTKLPRRVATFSRLNVQESIKYNNTGHPIYLSVNFLNYVDAAMAGETDGSKLSPDVRNWLAEYVHPVCQEHAKLTFLGTGANTEDTIVL